jgi:uncharacterized protein YodC (DUF2158 family)
MFKKGDVVKVNTVVVPHGPVLAMRMTEEGVVECLVEWNDGQQMQQRWFKQDDLIAG